MKSIIFTVFTLFLCFFKSADSVNPQGFQSSANTGGYQGCECQINSNQNEQVYSTCTVVNHSTSSTDDSTIHEQPCHPNTSNQSPIFYQSQSSSSDCAQYFVPVSYEAQQGDELNNQWNSQFCNNNFSYLYQPNQQCIQNATSNFNQDNPNPQIHSSNPSSSSSSRISVNRLPKSHVLSAEEKAKRIKESNRKSQEGIRGYHAAIKRSHEFNDDLIEKAKREFLRKGNNSESVLRKLLTEYSSIPAKKLKPLACRRLGRNSTEHQKQCKSNKENENEVKPALKIRSVELLNKTKFHYNFAEEYIRFWGARNVHTWLSYESNEKRTFKIYMDVYFSEANQTTDCNFNFLFNNISL